MKLNLIYILIILFQISYSQETKVSKRELLKAFKNSILQDKKGVIKVDSNPWFTENTDDLYFKKDTIVLKNARSYKRDYCKIIDWTFYKKDAFILGYADHCNEPPTRKVTKPEYWFSLKISDSENDLIIELLNQNKLIEKFKVLSLEKKESEYEKGEFDYILKILRLPME